MSDTAFPRGTPAPGFDLMSRKPRPGDRTTRSDDRYLFLEALLSARDKLILTAPARDLRDGSDLPPSVVVTELLDALDAAYSYAEGGTAKEAQSGLRAQLVVMHPLQAHSSRYFETEGDPRLKGRRAEAFAGARARREALEGGGGEPRRFLSESGIDRPREEGATSGPPTLSLDEMIVRVLKSAQAFSRDRLSLRLPNPEGSLDDLDPIDVGRLQRFGLGSALLSDLCEGAGAARRCGVFARIRHCLWACAGRSTLGSCAGRWNKLRVVFGFLNRESVFLICLSS